MNSRKDLETQIVQKLQTITPEDLQRLAEDYVRFSFPKRFPCFDFRALSPEGKSHSGWPDSYIVLSDDRVDGVEATTLKEKTKVINHLKDDLVKACKRNPKLAGFIFVSGNPTIQPNDTDLNMWRRRFADEAGIEIEHVNLVFGGQLVHELARPEFAVTRDEILGLKYLPKKFLRVRPAVPPNTPQADFIPSETDYENGLVYRPQAADRVLSHLEERGRVIVRGVGASGKTVLGWLIALENVRKRWPTYRLDMTKIDERVGDVSNVLENDLLLFGHPNVLFILDNIHLHENIAKRLAVAWEDIPHSRRPRLLLLGRELHTGRGRPFEGVDIPTLTLRARQSEVRGVYRRLAHSKTRSEDIPEPPPWILNNWVKTFGGNPASPDTTTDLIVFSAAVLKRLPYLIKGEWSLTVKDAVHEVREAYLDKLGEGEIRNLMRLAALAESEFFLTEEALADPRAGFKDSMRKMGLVFYEKTGSNEQYIRYRLAHTALGRLFIEAAYLPVDIAKEQLEVAFADPDTGFKLAQSLTVARPNTLAKTILTKIMEDPGILLVFLNQGYFIKALRLVQQHTTVSINKIDYALSDSVNQDKLVETALLTPIDHLESFLACTGKELKTVFKTLTKELGKKKNLDRLVETALDTPLGELRSFLAYAGETIELQKVFERLIEELGKEQNMDILVENTSLKQLHFLKNFLEYVGKKDNSKKLHEVFKSLTKVLGKKKNMDQLVSEALLSPLHFLQDFLAYIEGGRGKLQKVSNSLAYEEGKNELKKVFKTLTKELGEKQNPDKLVNTALDQCTSLSHLKSFLAYAAETKELQKIFKTLTKKLGEMQNRGKLVEKALLSPLHFLKNFLAYAEGEKNSEELQTIFKTLTKELGNEKNRKQLIETALAQGTSLSSLKSFFTYAGETKELKKVFTTLTKELENEQNRARLVERFYTTPLNQIIDILSDDTNHDVYRAVLIDLDEKEWERNCLRENKSQPDTFVRFQELVTVKGRPELAKAPALSLLRNPNPKQWHQDKIGFHVLSHCLAYATEATKEEIHHFLDRIATDDWLRYQMLERTKVDHLASSLLTLSTILPPELRNHVLCSSLRERVINELTTNSLVGERSWVEVLSLLGATAALGLRLDSIKTNWPSEKILADVLDLRAIETQSAKLAPLHVQLWIGMREMVRLREDIISIPAKHGIKILKLWQMTHDEIGQSLPLYVNEVNAEMITWLERCKANEWSMIKDDGCL